MRGRIRSVKPELFTDEKLWDLGQETGLPVLQAFEGLWCFADREGRFEWRPRALKTLILPYWNGDFARVLDALSSRGFLVRYTCDGREYGAVRNFLKHQTPNNRENASEIPAPPELQDIADTSTREERVDYASSTRDNPCLDKKKSSGSGILGAGSWEGEGSEPEHAPDGAASQPEKAPPREPTSSQRARTALASAVKLLASEFGYEVPPTASKAHMATAASKVLGLMAKGAEPAQAAERVARAAYERLCSGKSTTFGYALNDCVIGAPTGPRSVPSGATKGPLRPAPPEAFSPRTAEEIFGEDTV